MSGNALPPSDGFRTDVGWKQLQVAIEDKVDEVRRQRGGVRQR